jgi:hypothetical protein
MSRVRRDPWQGPAVATPHPSHEEIAQLAYAYWEAGGHGHGCSEEDWYRAERELSGRRPA